jgi:hypothetical protein
VPFDPRSKMEKSGSGICNTTHYYEVVLGIRIKFLKEVRPGSDPPPRPNLNHVLIPTCIFRPAAADSRGGLHHRGDHLHRGGGADLPDTGALQGRVADPDSIGSVDSDPDPGGQK